jgi:hypothetical protein
MDGWKSEIRDGDWLVMRWARRATLPEVEGRVALVARGDPRTGSTFHVKRIIRKGNRFLLASDHPDVPPVEAGPDDRPVALLAACIGPETLGPAPGVRLDEEEISGAFGISAAPRSPWSRTDGHLFILLEGEEKLSAPDRAAAGVSDARPGETAFVLARVKRADRWSYLGVGRRKSEEGSWEIPEVDFATWHALGHGRSASRRIEENWIDEARKVVSRIIEHPGAGNWVAVEDRRCRIVGPAAGGGLRIDGGTGGFRERTVSLADIAWVLKAHGGLDDPGSPPPDEAAVNRIRYLDGTPKGSTRWIDTGWARVLVSAASVG